jgi:Mrp family chromosome partitioning ATPase
LLLTRKDTMPAAAIAADCHLSIAAELRRFVAGGTRQILITSSGPGEGKSSVVFEVSRALARQPELRVVVVDTDQLRPSLHRLFGAPIENGLGELIQRTYGLDLAKSLPSDFGLGDWIELLQVQGKTGHLEVTEAGHVLMLTFIKGAIASIADRSAGTDQRLGALLTQAGHLTVARRDQALELASRTGEPLGEIALRLGFVEAGPLQAALRAQFGDRIQTMLAMAQPRCAFTEATERELGTAVTRDAAAAAGWAKQSGAMLMIREHLKQPYLTRALNAALKDTDADNLKLMTCGQGSINLLEAFAPAALRCILEHLAAMFDVVLVDSPPVALGSPAEVIGEMVAGTIMVVQADRFEATVIRRAKDRLEKHGARVLGVILNQVDLQQPDQSYHYYYLYYPTGEGNGKPRRRRTARRARLAAGDETTPPSRSQFADDEEVERFGIRRDRVGLPVTIGLVLLVVVGAILALWLAPWSQHPVPAGAVSRPAAVGAASATSAAGVPAVPAQVQRTSSAPPQDASGSVPLTAATAPPAQAAAPPAPAIARKPASASTARFTISVGTFLEKQRADTERLRIRTITPLTASVLRVSDGGDYSYRVVVGRFTSRAAAEKAASDLMGTGQVREAMVLPATAAAN